MFIIVFNILLTVLVFTSGNLFLFSHPVDYIESCFGL
jgi:hypothetical protein